ncbi:DsbA family protein [uncultured Ruegeria sp.]|uniref:DsbA family protein n=1 Tax=uncultured Ruegeria sp. TaxID=259304 RepID=UPI002604BD4E|nr:DsbA family protein [uncultured Ruegeria sp.]
MSFDTHVKSRLAVALTSRQLLRIRRIFHEGRRQVLRQPHVVHYFHDAADPYCHLTAQVLQRFQDRYRVFVRPYLISGPPEDAVPDPVAHHRNALNDSRNLARKLGLAEPSATGPDRHAVSQAEQALAAKLEDGEFLLGVSDISRKLWTGGEFSKGKGTDPSSAKARGDHQLSSFGHYIGGTFYYGGEWYWGVDRLHYLEDRLQNAGLGADLPPLIPVPDLQDTHAEGQAIEFFFSFRSPYSYLAFDRVWELARRSGADLVLRPVLPMLMRGLPVPKAKSSYILLDCAREARRLGVPFGRICDPLGVGVERGYALLDHAHSQGRMVEYCSAFLRGVWSQGLDASTNNGLAQIVGQAGLDWNIARQELTTQNWRARVEQNQDRLQEIGLWGVPSFRVSGQSIWGQDRLWAVEDALVS